MRKSEGRCSVKDCDRDARTKRMCDKHYKMFWKYGRTKNVNATPGTGWMCEDGYRRICINRVIKYEHVFIAEKALGREFKDTEMVHHVNGVKWDNHTPFNLVICPNQTYHKLLHKRAEELQKYKKCLTTW